MDISYHVNMYSFVYICIFILVAYVKIGKSEIEKLH